MFLKKKKPKQKVKKKTLPPILDPGGGREWAALREREALYQALIETTGTGYVVLDQEGRVLDANSEYVRLAGYRKFSEISGRSVLEWTADHEKVRNAEAIAKCWQDGHIRNFEIDYVDPKGRVTPVELNATMVESGGTPRILTLCRDITERRKVETDLRASEIRFKNIVSASPMGMHLYELTDDERLVFIGANDAADQILGISHNQLIGKSIEEAFPGLKDTEILKQYRAAARNGLTWRTEQINYDHGSIRGAFEVVAFQTEPGKMVALFNEITERKKAETALRASLREKELLLQELNHRVNNNLQLISNLLKLQRKYIKDKNALCAFDESQNRIQSIALVHEKLYLTKGFSNINLSQYIADLARNIFHTFVKEDEGIKLKVDVEDITLTIERAITCGLIVNELLSNALKYAFPNREKGEVVITLHRSRGETVELVFCDNGVGLPAEIDLRSTRTLGMKLISTLVEKQLEGTLSVERKQGTIFRIKFKDNPQGVLDKR